VAFSPAVRVHQGFIFNFMHQQTNFDPALDRMLFAYCRLERKMAIKETYWLYTMCTSLK